MRGRKPKLTFSEQIKLRTIQAAYGQGSAEEEAFWKQVRIAAKMRYQIKRGSIINRPRRKKHASIKEANRESSKRYYERNKAKILEQRKAAYKAKKESQS